MPRESAYEELLSQTQHPPYESNGLDRPGPLRHLVGTTPEPEEGSKSASGVLKEAHEIVVGARQTQHGEKERSFKVIAQLWDVYLNGRKDGGPVTAFDVAQMLCLLKIARSIQGSRIRDHAVDACGYAAIAWEVAE